VTRTRDLIKLEATDTGSGVAYSSRLQAIVDAGKALADDITTGLAGLHAYDTGPDFNIDADALQVRLKWRGVDLETAFALRSWWKNSALVDAEVLDQLFRAPEVTPPIALGFLDVVRRSILKSSNFGRVRSHFRAVSPWALPKMEQELTGAYIEMYAECEPRWVKWLFETIVSGTPQFLGLQ
jgi:hypothetical protein